MGLKNGYNPAGGKMENTAATHSKSSPAFFTIHYGILFTVLLCLWVPFFAFAESGTEKSTDDLIAMLKNDDPELRKKSVDELVAMGPEAVAPLIAALEDQNAIVRREAISALGILKDPRAVDPLFGWAVSAR